jgi:menaquinone-9 beta-reductase
MGSDTYDIITVGGGLGGSSLAKAMAEHGARVLVLERETQFKDRVRGEVMVPWGVAEAQKLGLYDLLRQTCAHELRWLDFSAGSLTVEQRDFVTTSAPQLPALTFYHPVMQEVLLTAAEDAGATVRRRAQVREVKPGPMPTVIVEQDGRSEEVRARLVVGADGRSSLIRKWAGFPVQHDPQHLLIAGVWFEEMAAVPPDRFYWRINIDSNHAASLFPQGDGKVRAYFEYHTETPFRLHGEGDVARFIEACVAAGASAQLYAGAKTRGPLATFECADSWVEHPYREGIALIGDAAATSDPTWGQGLALTVRDARVLRDQLLKDDDWEAAGHAYAVEHDRHYGVIHRVNNWLAEMFYEPGPVGKARRARALPLIAQDPTRMPDHVVSGPELPADETVKQRFFGEE